MRVALASDHAGYSLKEYIKSQLSGGSHDVIDLGTQSPDVPDDYPDYAELLGEAVLKGRADRGILICGSGVGAAVAANKIPGIRAGLCHDTYSAHQGVEHDNMNILVLGGRVIGVALALEIANRFLAASFSGEERHVRRLSKVSLIERKYTSGN